MISILEAKGLSKRFGGVTALKDVSFSVKSGEIFGIIGPNGAGKTTLFNVITGMTRPDSGKVFLSGKDITGLRAHEISRLGVARTFQNLRLFKDMSVYENLKTSALSRENYSLLAAFFRTDSFYEIEKKTEELVLETLKFFNLYEKKDLKASSLPYGEQRKLELARALLTRPKVLLIDEPAAGMNQREISDLIELILKIRKEYDLTIVVIEHQMKLIMNISERMMVMDFGEKIMEGTPNEVKKDERVIRAYLGEDLRCLR